MQVWEFISSLELYFILNKINPSLRPTFRCNFTSESQFPSAEASLPRPHSFIILLECDLV
ncbi:MAG: hypothetical protein ACTS5A_01330 [Candidatus Hodgkinia cicadicola]